MSNDTPKSTRPPDLPLHIAHEGETPAERDARYEALRRLYPHPRPDSPFAKHDYNGSDWTGGGLLGGASQVNGTAQALDRIARRLDRQAAANEAMAEEVRAIAETVAQIGKDHERNTARILAVERALKLENHP